MTTNIKIEKKTENAFEEYKNGSSRIVATDYFDLFYSLWEILHADVAIEEKSVIPLAFDRDITVLNQETAVSALGKTLFLTESEAIAKLEELKQ